MQMSCRPLKGERWKGERDAPKVKAWFAATWWTTQADRVAPGKKEQPRARSSWYDCSWQGRFYFLAFIDLFFTLFKKKKKKPISIGFFGFFLVFPSSPGRRAWSVSWPHFARPAGVGIVPAQRALFYASFCVLFLFLLLFLSFPFASCDGPFFCFSAVCPRKTPAIVSVCVSVVTAAPCIPTDCRDVAR